LKIMKTSKKKKSDKGTKSNSTTGVPKMFPTVTASFGLCIVGQGEYLERDPSQ